MSPAVIQELPTIDGDPDGYASAVNDLGQAVGATGSCGRFNAENSVVSIHAVLWQNGKAINLGNLGGDGRFFGIFANGLNDRGQVVGTSDTTGDQSFHGFLWQGSHLTDLLPLPSDAFSYAVTVSNEGVVLGLSITDSFSATAVLWRDGPAIDMNTLGPPDTALYLETACSINDKGEIIGIAALKSNLNEAHGYLAKPVWNSDDRH